MANLYYNAAVDTAWDTLGNWWNDVAFTSPAAALPTDGDTVYLGATMTSGPSTAVTLNNIYVAHPSTGGGNFGVNFNQVYGDALFYDASYNSGIFQGNATFNDYSYNAIGVAVFGDNATFNDYSYNDGDGSGGFFSSAIVNNDGTFNDFSYNNGNVNFTSGLATFNGSSYNMGASQSGSYVFNDDSSNLRTSNEGKTATFNGPYAEGRIADNSSYGDLTINMTAPSGGGSDNTIARLLDLPWFINL